MLSEKEKSLDAYLCSVQILISKEKKNDSLWFKEKDIQILLLSNLMMYLKFWYLISLSGKVVASLQSYCED